MEHANSKVDIKLNDPIERLLKDSNWREQLKVDWRKCALAGLNLNDDQKSFIQALPAKSVDAIQSVVCSVIKSDGRIYFAQDSNGDVELLADHLPENGATPTPDVVVKLKICKFDANFRNCKWFWQR